MGVENDIKGTVLNIQHYCYHDGPGVRTTVFLKGCSLRCKWCGNPESIEQNIQLAYDKKECLGCEKCGICLKPPFEKGLFGTDSEGAITLTDKARLSWDHQNIDLCPTKAIFLYGEEKSVSQVIAEVNKDIPFYRKSGGGITISGGEPLLQPEFTAELLKKAHANGYTTAIETASNVPWESMDLVLPFTDTVLHDIKIFDSARHKKWTGAENKRILENLERAYEKYPDKTFITRTPIIHGVNDDYENINAILDFILPYKNVKQYELLPYHKLGVGKYKVLGLDYPLDKFEAPSEDRLEELRELIKDAFHRREQNSNNLGGI